MKRVRLRRVSNHYLIDVDDDCNLRALKAKKASRAVKSTLLRWGVNEPADYAILATCEGKVVGFFRYGVNLIMDGEVKRRRRVLTAAGTWVSPRFRRQRLAVRMWRLAIRRGRVTRVDVQTVSAGGSGLVGKMAKLVPSVEFCR